MKILPEVSAFFAQPLHGNYFGGRSHPAISGETMAVMNPSDGAVLATVAHGGTGDVDSAIKAAHSAFPGWAALPSRERAVFLQRLGDAIERHGEALAQIESLDVGKAIAAARAFDIPFGGNCTRYYAELASQAPLRVPLALPNMEAHIHRTPYGACSFIFPWNFPFLLLLWGIIPALAAGNTVVVKPSEVTPMSTLFLARLFEEAGFPEGVFNVVLGTAEVGSRLSENPLIRHMSFTGSPSIGRHVGEACGRNFIPLKLELGGKGAAVLFEDANVEAAAEALAGAITLNTGQVCCTASRWVVHENIRDRFLAKTIEVLNNTKIGPAGDEETQMGPAASCTHRTRVLNYIDRGVQEGAEVLLEGGAASVEGFPGGYYIKPTLLSGSESNVCYREEIFGPVAFVSTFQDEDSVIARVNTLSYGLANSVWSTDLGRANRVAERLVAGNSWINAHNIFAYGLPYGGVNLSGLGGGVNGPGAFYDYLRNLTVARPL